MDLVAECRERSRDLLHRAAGPAGFVASPEDDHYDAVWVRDAAVACLGAHRTGDPALLAAARATIETMLGHPGPAGQVPNTVWRDGTADWGEAGAADPSAWAVIVTADHHAATGDTTLLTAAAPLLRDAWTWLASQDPANTGLVSSAPATDWMDSSLQRSGWVLHVNVLAAWAAGALEALAGVIGPVAADAARRRERLDAIFWPAPGAAEFRHHASQAAYAAAVRADRRHYLSHVSHAAFVDRCDVLANLLAVVSGVASADRAGKIVDGLHEMRVAEPHPTRTWDEPATADHDPWQMWDRAAERHIPERWRNPPYRYHNAGVWPYVGGFHAAALAVAGRTGAARLLLERVAAANRIGGWGFHEWLDGRTGEPGGARAQAWNAGAFLFADEVIRSGVTAGGLS